jgi:Lrp/AsnC family transcriptional regulator
LEAHRLAGDIDYILKVRVENAKAYDAFYRSLIAEVPIFNVTSTLSMEEIKYTTAQPLRAIARRTEKKEGKSVGD